MDGEKVDELIKEIQGLNSPEAWKALMEELSLLLSGISPGEPHGMDSLVPIDVPIQSTPADGTGLIRIRFPFRLGRRTELGWHSISITPDAQVELVRILVTALRSRGITEVQLAPKPQQ
jgi:hypothetical protein